MNVIYFLSVATFWGGSFIAIKPLVAAMPAFLAGSVRIGVALIFLAMILPMLRIPLSVPSSLRSRVWATGIMAFGLPFALLFWGEQSITPGLAGILNGTVPLWVYVLGMIFTPRVEAVTVRKTLGLVFGIAGVLAIFLPRVLVPESLSAASEALPSNSLWGALAVTLMAASYGVSVLCNRSVFQKNPTLHPFSNLFQQLVAGFASLMTLSLLVEGVPNPSAWGSWSTIIVAELYLGCVSTSIAFMMFYRLIREWGSVRASTVTYVVPTAALILDLVLNRHLPAWNEVLGVIAVTAGVVTLNFPAEATRAFAVQVAQRVKRVRFARLPRRTA